MSANLTTSALLFTVLAIFTGCAGDNKGSDASTEVDTDVTEEPIDWTGTWTIDIDYELECTNFASTDQQTFSGSWALPLDGDNENLSASLESGWFVLEGSGNDDGLRLTGEFHLDGIWSSAMSGSDNNISFRGDDVVSKDEVNGEMTGSFVGESGEDCDILSGSFVMTR